MSQGVLEHCIYTNYHCSSLSSSTLNLWRQFRVMKNTNKKKITCNNLSGDVTHTVFSTFLLYSRKRQRGQEMEQREKWGGVTVQHVHYRRSVTLFFRGIRDQVNSCFFRVITVLFWVIVPHFYNYRLCKFSKTVISYLVIVNPPPM